MQRGRDGRIVMVICTRCMASVIRLHEPSFIRFVYWDLADFSCQGVSARGVVGVDPNMCWGLGADSVTGKLGGNNSRYTDKIPGGKCNSLCNAQLLCKCTIVEKGREG